MKWKLSHQWRTHQHQPVDEEVFVEDLGLEVEVVVVEGAVGVAGEEAGAKRMETKNGCLSLSLEDWLRI